MENYNQTASALKQVLLSGTEIATSVMATLIGRPNSATGTCRQTEVTSRSLYSLKEVSDHCDTSSLWIVIHDKVYDVTDFLSLHPGGLEILLEHAGRDATVDFVGKGHSNLAVTMLENYCIGALVERDRMVKGNG